MEIKQDQKNRFDEAFRSLMQHAPEEIQHKWDGLITWSDGIPHPYIQGDVLRDLSPEQYDMYLMILTKFRLGLLT